MSGENTLGEFLRARRAKVQPEDLGIESPGQRRVSGLRREELAMLSGVSIAYITRLEQGRDRHPSAQVLQALAKPLRLDDEALGYLTQLAEPQKRRRTPRRAEHVRPGIEQLLATYDANPALVRGRYRDVLAANSLAIALAPMFTPGRNLLRDTFLDPASRETFPDWEHDAAASVAELRLLVGRDLDDARLTDLVGELSMKSEAFRRLWAGHEVHGRSSGRKRFLNPLVGELALHYEALTINGSDDQTLVVYYAEPHSPDHDALMLLGKLTTAERAPRVVTAAQAARAAD